MFSNLVDRIDEAISDGFEYQSNVSILISDHPKDMDYDPRGEKVTLRFNFDFEFRSWGIKDVSFDLLTPQIVVYFKVNDAERSVTIDKEQIEIDWTPGQVYTVGALELYLNADLSVKEATLEVFYPQMG